MWSSLGNVAPMLLLADDIENCVSPSPYSISQSHGVPASKSQPNTGSGGAIVVVVVVVVGVGAWVVAAITGKTRRKGTVYIRQID